MHRALSSSCQWRSCAGCAPAAPSAPAGPLAAVKNVTPAPPYRTTGRITWNIERWELQ